MFLATVAAGFGGAGASGGDDCEFRFVEIGREAGLRFVHDAGRSGGLHLPETMGAGVAWIDFDGDGWLDLYLVQSGEFPPSATSHGSDGSADRLFRNLGPDAGGRIRFEAADVGAPPKVRGVSGYGQGVVAADVDGDRDVDLLVTRYGPTVLLLNGGDGSFAAPAPLPAAMLPAGGDGREEAFPWGSSLALADADGDGDLDLYVSRYIDYDPDHGLACRRDGPGSAPEVCDPSLFLGQRDRYYVNRGGGEYEDATEAAGLAGANGRGLGVVFSDLDGDGRPDLYVANDLTLNLLFLGAGDGTFEDRSLLSGAAVDRNGRPQAGMGLALADFDADGDPDLAVTNFDVETNTLYRNDGASGELLFEDVSAASGFGQPSFNLLGFGIVAEDFDRDGALDLYVANGHIFTTPRRDNTSYRQRDLLLRGGARGQGSSGSPGTFAEARCGWAAREPLVSRGAAVADVDLDGDGDVVVTANDGPARLWRNDTPDAQAGDWLGVELRGAEANTQAVGAVVTLFGGVPGGASAPVARRWVLRGDSYQSSSGHRLRWAVAPAARAVSVDRDASVDQAAAGGADPAAANDGARGGTRARHLDVRWPSGAWTRIVDPPTGAYLVVEERR